MSVRGKASGKKGFSLIEVLISLAVLALAGAAAARIFVAAGTAQALAMKTDKAMLLAGGEIEAFRAGQSPEAYIEGFDGVFLKERLEGERYFDEAWRPVDAAQNSGYALGVKITPAGPRRDDDGVISQLYAIDVRVKTRPEGEELISMETTRLFIYRP